MMRWKAGRISALGLILALSAPTDSAADPFTVALLPDTQHYSDSSINIANFQAQTQWIVDNQVAEGIVFSTLLGDVVENGALGPGANQVEWDRAVGSLDTLHDHVSDPPYAAVIGNHDYDVKSDKSSAVQYILNLGPARYAGKSWLAGAAANQLSMAQLFEVSGEPFLHLGLEWHPSDEAIEFAQGLITANPTVPVIVSTHEHLDRGNPAPRRFANGDTPNSTGDNDGEQVYRKLVEPFPQVFLVLSGHQYGNGRLESSTALGRTVHEVMTDYQNDPNGGNGWLQLARFRPQFAEIEFLTLSPSYVPGVTAGPDRSLDPDGNFTLAYDLETLRDDLATRVVLHYRQGQDNGFGTYTNAVDTHVGNGGTGITLPGTSYGGEDNLRVDSNTDSEQGLVRFDNVVGTAPGQIAPGTPIQRAVLTLTTEGPASEGDGAALHRMLIAWDGSSTWNGLGGGVQLGAEAESLADANTGFASNGTRSYDVTTSVQAWVDGAANHGWVLLANGPDRWEFRSSEWAGTVERPMLTVEYASGPAPPSDCQDGIDNDGDGRTDFPGDPGCANDGDSSELDANLACDDGIDNDSDGLVDFRTTGGDPGCQQPAAPKEDPQCQDGFDNDGQTGTDFDGGESIWGPGNGDPNGPDPQCLYPWSKEAQLVFIFTCGLGPELAFVLPLIGLCRRRLLRPAN